MIYPKAVATGWPQERLEAWGADNPLYVSRVLGEHPEEGEDTLIRLAWIESAKDRDAQEMGESAIGIDVARFGTDETVFFRACGPWTEMLEAYQGKDLMKTAGRAMRYGKGADYVAIDDVGLGGGVTDRVNEILQERARDPESFDLAAHFEVTPINNGSKALNEEDFADLGSEMMWELREAFRETYEMATAGEDDPTRGISIPADELLVHQLSVRKYDYKSTGKIKVESKADMKKRGEKSPDRADALAEAWWAKSSHAIPAASTPEDFQEEHRDPDGEWDWREHSTRPRERRISRGMFR
jgi:hypothetical protein